MSDKLRQAAQQALDALGEATCYTDNPAWSPSATRECEKAIVALREALAEQPLNLKCKSTQKRLATLWGFVHAEAQEPVAWRLRGGGWQIGKPSDEFIEWAAENHPETPIEYAIPQTARFNSVEGDPTIESEISKAFKMTTPSNSAKAAAAMHFVCGIRNFKAAVQLYDKLPDTDKTLDKVLKEHCKSRWEPFENMNEKVFPHNMEELARSIDTVQEHLKMSEPSSEAKAAAVMNFVCGVPPAVAPALYDAIVSSDNLDEFLELNGYVRWKPFENMSENEFTEYMEELAHSIDAAREHFK